MGDFKDKLYALKIIEPSGVFGRRYENKVHDSGILDELIKFTSFLPDYFTIRERLYCIIHNIKNTTICRTCGIPVRISKQSGFLNFCSNKCSQQSPETISKRLKTYRETYAVNGDAIRMKKDQTCLERYGHKNPSSSEHVRSKFKKTCLERFGTDSPLHSKPIRDKIKDTLIDRYGEDNPLKIKTVREKIKNTNIERYGHDYPIKNIDIKKKQLNTLMEKYGVINPSHSVEINERRISTNLEKYGTKYSFINDDVKAKYQHTMIERYGHKHNWSVPDIQDKIKNTNIELYGVDYYNRRHISTESLELLQNEEWLRTQHHVLKRTVECISNELCVDHTTVGNSFKKFNIEVKYFWRSMGERELSECLTLLNVPHNINDRKIISVELDVYIPQYKLAIEYCGLYWHSDVHHRITKNTHKIKHDLCVESGIQLLTIFDDEWREHKNIIINKIKRLCNICELPTIYARNCNIVEVDVNQKSQFFNQYHIQGNGPGSINYGLTYNDNLVACVSFIKKQNGEYYLNRYATSVNLPGGFSKLLKHFEKYNEWQQIISFADCRWSDGNLYYKNNFILDKILPPDYCYSGDRGKTRTHKFNYRRKNLPKLLKEFDPALSETQNCDNNGILRIWDCGKMRFIKNNTKI